MAVRAPEGLVQRVRSEFLEMPGLKLTAVQAQQLWGLDCATAEAILVSLAEDRFLIRTPDGAFVLGKSRDR